MLCNLSDQDKLLLRKEITDWQALVIDTYEELKKETSMNPDDNLTPMQREIQRASIAVPRDQAQQEINKIMRLDSMPTQGENVYGMDTDQPKV
jgi:hypothetical protein